MANFYALNIGWRYVFSERKTHLVSFLSFLSIFGVVMAVALLIVVLSVMSGFDKEMRGRILSLVPHVSLYFDQPDYDLQQALSKVKAHPDVIDAFPFVQFQAMLVRGEKAESALVSGLLVSEGGLRGLSRFVDADSWQQWSVGEGGIILGSKLAEKMGLTPGDQVNLLVVDKGSDNHFPIASFRLAGVLLSGTELDQGLAIITYRQVLQSLPDLGGDFGIQVQLDDVFSAERVAWELQQNIPGFPYARDWTSSYGNLYQAIQLSKNLVAILLLSVIAVAAFNIVASLVLIVVDKQADIVILRTQGATPAYINSIFLSQGAIIGIYGCVLGSVIGVAVAWFAADLVSALEAVFNIRFLSSDVYPIDYLPVDIRVDNIVMINLVTLIMCVLAAIFPARKASQVSPARVLRWQ